MVPAPRQKQAMLETLRQLRYCEQELDRRCDSQSSDCWYWEIKRKVARFGIGLCEQDVQDAEAGLSPELTAWEKSETRRTHRLLRPYEPVQSHRFPTVETDWMTRLRRNIHRYLKRLRERPGAE